MYPRLFQIPLPFEIGGVDTITIYSFGAMMAVAFLVAAWLSRVELDRLYAAGRIKGVRMPVPENPQKKGKKAKKSKRRVTMKEVSPSYLVGTLTIVAVVGGIVGAKLFHILENLGDFGRDPIGMIFSVGGLTFYGGLIVAALSISWYVRSKGLSVPVFSDAVLPTVLIAYGIGRVGCYLAGDGDWGVCSSLADKPGWIPAFLWSETFPNNLMGPGQTPLDVLAYEQCAPGASGVFPTMLYEFGMCLALFGVLWALRKHPFKGGWLFSLALIFFGVERFLIEQIRVNNTFDLFGLTVTQAEIISVVLMVLGIIGLVRTTKRREPNVPQDEPPAVAAPAT